MMRPLLVILLRFYSRGWGFRLFVELCSNFDSVGRAEYFLVCFIKPPHSLVGVRRHSISFSVAVVGSY